MIDKLKFVKAMVLLFQRYWQSSWHLSSISLSNVSFCAADLGSRRWTYLSHEPKCASIHPPVWWASISYIDYFHFPNIFWFLVKKKSSYQKLGGASHIEKSQRSTVQFNVLHAGFAKSSDLQLRKPKSKKKSLTSAISNAWKIHNSILVCNLNNWLAKKL